MCIFFLVVALIGGSALPVISSEKGVQSATTEQIQISVEQNQDILLLSYAIEDYSTEEILINGEIYERIVLEKEPNLVSKGNPELAYIARSVIVPDSSTMDIRVLSAEYIEYNQVKIAPSKGNLLRSVDPSTVPYEFGNAYTNDAWFPETIVELREPYILRDFRGQVVLLTPFQYNPVQEKLRFYQHVKLEVFPQGPGTINCITQDELPPSLDSEFLSIYERHFLNFPLGEDRYESVDELGNMLVITYDDFWDDMIPFVQWKNFKGIPTEMINVSEIGSANAIKTYIQEYYDTYGLTFVLLVGDIQQMPSLYPSYGASDPSYSYVVGGDHYPDLFVGRFSAQNSQQVATQVERTIAYERDPQAGAVWYHTGTGVASDLGPGDDGEYDDEHIDNIRADLLGYTYTEVDQIYDPYATASLVAAALNEGRSIVNYCGHGSYRSWSSSGFDIDDVNLLENSDMLPFIWSVACSNGEFDTHDTCFAEAWLRATHNGEPTGAIAAFMSSVSQSWNPPMDAQDEMADILVESYATNRKTSFGGLCFNGCMHMNDEYGTEGYETTDTWHVFGDPSLQVRTDEPSELLTSHASSIPNGSMSFEVEVNGVKGALCAISRENILLGSAYTDETGYAIIEFDEPISYGSELDLVVTGYNYFPYFATLVVSGDDDPPETPAAPGGEVNGIVHEVYTFSAVTTDPEEDDIAYRFDWGDGNLSDWTDYVPSGTEKQASYSWILGGIYQVRVRARDSYGAMSGWSPAHEISIGAPALSISKIRGGLGKIVINIKNVGEASAHAIDWTIKVTGGALGRINISSGCDTCTETLEIDQFFIERTNKFIFGLGKINITVTARADDVEEVMEQAQGFVFGPFIFGVRSIAEE